MLKHSYRDEVKHVYNTGGRKEVIIECFIKIRRSLFNACKNNDPRRVCGRLLYACRRAAGPKRVFDRAARGSNTVCFSSYVLLCLSHLVRASGHGGETTT